jgi:class 3 adenylate cyclase/tetratricopeptide (TPR) repeat protein
MTCGRALASDTLAPRDDGASAPSRPLEERRHLTVLFADLAGYTAVAERMDPEDVKRIVERCLARLGKEVERCGGEVHQYLGDGLMGVFGAPVSHEDDPERAVRAGLAMQAVMTQSRDMWVEAAGEPFALRVGINSGDVLVGPFADRYSVVGDAVNVASRLEGMARPGRVIVGEETFHATRHAIDYRSLGPARLKGKAQLVSVWEARGPLTPVAGLHPKRRGEAQFIGRDVELGMLVDAFERSVRERQPQFVTVIGEPGAGKSRLVREFVRHAAAGRTSPTVRCGRCPAYGEGVTFWALGEIVKAHCAIRESDSPEIAVERLNAALEVLEGDARARDWLLVRVAPLVGARVASPAVERDQTEAFAAWRLFLEAAGADRPLILVIEDVHWADAPLLDFLAYLAESLRGVPVLSVVTTRPTGDGGCGLRAALGATVIALAPLEHRYVGRLIDDLIGPRPLRPTVHAEICRRAGGNPLFAEELARMVVERQTVGGDVDGRDESAIVPDTVQAVISARLDTLTDDEKMVVHDAAVVGETFWPGALGELAQVDAASIGPLLDRLARREFIRVRPTSAVAGEREYAFWHVLVRDVAYQRLPRVARAAKHRAAARWIEHMAGDRSFDHAELLAGHFSAALELSRSTPGVSADVLRNDAAHTLIHAAHAGERATMLQANDEAARHYRTALEALDLADSSRAARRCQLLVACGEAERRAGRVDSAKQTLERAADLAIDLDAGESLARAALAYGGPSVQMSVRDDRVVALLETALQRVPAGAPALRARLLARLAMELYFTDAVERRAALIQEAMRVGRAAKDPAALAFVLSASHWTLWGPANSEERLEIATELLRLGERLAERELALQGHHWRLTDLIELGDIAAADRELEAHARAAEELRQPYYLWQTTLRLALRAHMNGDFVAAQRLADSAWRMGVEVDSDTADGYLLAMRIVLARDLGGLSECEPQLSRGVERYPAQMAWRAWRAWLHTWAGNLAAAAADLDVVARGEFEALQPDYRWMGAVAQLSDVTAALGDRDRASVLYDALQPFADRNVVFGRTAAVLGSASHYLGQLAMALGRWDEADAHLQRALAMHVSMRAPPLIAHTQLARAKLALSRGAGSKSAAASDAAQAAEIAGRLGMERLAAEARALAAGDGARAQEDDDV